MIAGDVGMNILGLGDPVGFEDIEEGRRSQRKVATLRFNAAVSRRIVQRVALVRISFGLPALKSAKIGVCGTF